MRRALLYVITVYASAPVVLYLFPWILGHIIFSHLLRFPFFVDLSRPELVLNHTCNFYLNTDEGVSVGVWHTLPASQWEEAAGKRPEWYRETLKDGNPVIIYLHGNLGTRWDESSIEVILSAAGYHVLSLDYRGFGDSTGEPSEAGLTSDALYLYQWVKVHSRGGLVCLWGHSLRHRVSFSANHRIDMGAPKTPRSVADALILEAPYTRMRDVVDSHVIAKMYLFVPGIQNLLWDILDRNNIEFANDENLKTVTSPLLILHAEDDNIVPHHMGLKLYQISLQARKKTETDAQVEMISNSARRGFSHNGHLLGPQSVRRGWELQASR
ncbi:hypothetical protein fugu_016927 [Takifugu bimaculatus]|uniref:AB hydrolase-1 domain-containing protein n=1 Tax=Takifugu bimaculatus TaxID=433685 RepID=A0A4Z2BUD6_9TELE|nr:hypothetical protein fugu_016927 [Takifugu bimaculatus]